MTNGTEHSEDERVAGVGGRSDSRGDADSGWPERLARLAPQRFDIRIDAEGNWHHEGEPITRMAIVRLFSTVLMRHADGSYWLATPAERGRIEVEDVPFVIVAMHVEEGDEGQPGDSRRAGQSAAEDHIHANREASTPLASACSDKRTQARRRRIRLRTNVQDEIVLRATNPLVMRPGTGGAGDLRPYVLVREGLEARVSRPVYYELAELSAEGPCGRLGVWSDGSFFALEDGSGDESG